MNNLTKMKIFKPANEVFEAFVDPAKIGNFWFSTSSERWGKGKTITVEYKEYNATVNLDIIDIVENEKIVFEWGSVEEKHTVTISLNALDNGGTVVEVNEEGFIENNEDFIHQLIDNKEGWVYMLTCLKGYLEFGISDLRAALVK